MKNMGKLLLATSVAVTTVCISVQVWIDAPEGMKTGVGICLVGVLLLLSKSGGLIK